VHEVKTDLGTQHMADFLAAMRSRGRATCSIEAGYQSTATVQLAMAAYETTSTLSWDASSERVTDNPAAAKLLRREYRTPWKHPYKA